MNIRAQCPCGAVFELESSFAGMTVGCARCQQRFVVPENLPPPPAREPRSKPAATKPAVRRGAPRLGMFAATLLTLLAIPVVVAGYRYLSASQESLEIRGQLGGTVELIESLIDLEGLDGTIRDLISRGYEPVSGQLIRVRQPVGSKTLYICQAIEIDDVVNTDIAIIAQGAVLRGTVNGNLEFSGQSLRIERKAAIRGNVHANPAQFITVRGTIEGTLSGNYGSLSILNGDVGSQAPSDRR